jgi:protein-S-isoprenylcysteine O-methyltransferase Ste14
VRLVVKESPSVQGWEPSRWRYRIAAMLETSRVAAYILLVLAYALGYVPLALFALFLWSGPFPLISLNLTTPEIMCFDALLAVAFFVQHSGMIRRSFRAKLAPLVPEQYQPAFYTIVSGLVLLLVPLFWQPTHLGLLILRGSLCWLVRAAFLAALAVMVWGFRSLKYFDPLGTRSLLGHLRGQPAPDVPFTISGAYRWVRHPLYTSCLLMVWASPDVTADRLLFNVVWSVWMVVATKLEERDLIADFGEVYREYQRSVPMLLPRSLPPRT